MAQIYGELIRAQLQSATNLTIGADASGLIYLNTGDKKLTVYDGTDWQKLVTETALTSSLSGKVDANAAITGDTKTKITFDSKGLVTSGADLEIGDIPTITAEKGGLGEDASAFTGVLKASAGTFSAAELVDADVSATAAIAQSKIENLTTDLGNKVEANAAITGDTKTKITYDAKGLVTFGDDLTSDDIPSTLLNKFVSSTDSMTGALLLPVGTTGEQPAAAEQGMIRYNTTDATFEGYNGTAWGAIGGGGGGTIDTITQASHGFVVGDVLYLNGATYEKAKADAANTAEVVGVVSSVLSSSQFQLTLSGEVSGLTGLVAGEVYFLSADTAGALTTTEPTVVGQVSLPVGVASSTTSLYVAPKRGAVVGSSNARTQIALANNATTTVQDISAYDAGELTGWISITATTPLRFYVAAQFSKNGAANNYNVSYQVSGDTPPTGFSVTATAAGLLQVTLPSVTGFASASINYALNAPAVGTTFPLSIDASSVVSGTVSSDRLPSPTTYSDAEATRMGLKQYLHGTAYNGGIAPTVTCSQAGFSVIKAVFIPYQMQDFTWRLKFNFLAAYTAANISSLTVLVNGIVTNNVTNQIISGSFGASTSNATMRGCSTGAGNNTLVFNALSTGTTSVVGGSGDIELDSKPTWAY